MGAAFMQSLEGYLRSSAVRYMRTTSVWVGSGDWTIDSRAPARFTGGTEPVLARDIVLYIYVLSSILVMIANLRI